MTLLLFLPLMAKAASFTDGTFAYNINKDKQTVTVVANSTAYSGDLTIPATVTNDGTTYQVTEIGESAFKNCTRLYSIQFPEGLKVINNSAFEGCTGLESIKVPNSVESLSYSCFKGCRLLGKVDLGTGIKDINGNKEGYTGSGAFENCTSLTSIVIPASVENIYASAFRGCTALETVTLADGVEFIGSSSFQNCSSLTAITIPASVTTLGASVFVGCKSLEKAVIGKGVKTMGNEVFKNCQALEQVTIQEGCAIISSAAFQGCIALSAIDIPGSIATIGHSSFKGCRSLARVTLGYGISTIFGNKEGYTGSGAFEDCISLENIDIPGSVTDINASVFRGCTSLTTVTLNKGLLTIGSCCFQNCTSLNAITIPTTVSHLGTSMFSGCKSLETATIGKGVTEMGNEIFKGCAALKKVTIEKGCAILSSEAFQNCTSLTSINIPGTITDVGYSAFQGCTSLISVNVEKGVTAIHGNKNGYTGNGAFEDCTALEEVKLPSSISYIYASAFRNCTSLKRFTIEATVLPEVGTKVFDKTPVADATLYVPEKVIEKYRSTEPWSTFGTIEIIDGETSSNEWYMKTDDGTMIPMASVSLLVAADDDVYFAVMDTNGSFLHENVKRARFVQGDHTGIQPTVSSEHSDIMKRLINNQLTIIGAKENIEIFNMAGTKQLQVSPRDSETVINVTTLPSGIYVVKCGKLSFKFTKK